jgi:RHS repeat-associated protein
MSDASGITSWSYDERGRMTGETRSISGGLGTFVTGWGYNKADLPVSMRYPADNLGGVGEVVTTTYTKQLTPDSLLGNFPQAYVLETRYDAAGRTVKREMGNTGGLLTQYVYNPWTSQGGRLQQLSAGPGGSPNSLLNLQYNYDVAGNVLTIQDYVNGSPQTQTFTYDNLYRLTSAKAENGNLGNYGLESYNYNPTTGNLTSKAGVNYTYDVGNHDHAVISLTNGNAYSYDANGNMTYRLVNGQTFNLTYDSENRMVQVSGAVNETFKYNGDGQRIIATQGVTTTVYIANYFEWHGTTADMVKYYYSGANRVAMRVGVSAPVFLMGDHLGSTSVAVNEQGAPVGGSPQLYKAWGETRAGSMPTRYQYTGQYNQIELGIYYYNARWYDGYLNRWAQPDPIIPDPYNTSDWDRYSYVRNNPVGYIDPTGHGPCTNGRTDCINPHNSAPGIDRPSESLENQNARAQITYNKKRVYYQNCLENPGSGCPDVKEIAEFIGASLVLASADILGLAAFNQLKALWGMLVESACADGDCTDEVQQVLKGIGETGDLGESWLKQFGGVAQKYFNTSQGGRFIDQLIKGMAYEAKVGYVSLTEEISIQVAKDVELLFTGQVDSVSWVFFPSPITGLFGPSGPLYNLLIQNGISVFIVRL